MTMHAVEHPFETGLERSGANFVPLSPTSFLTRAASAALLHGPGMRAQLPQPRLWFRRCGRRSGVPAPACG